MNWKKMNWRKACYALIVLLFIIACGCAGYLFQSKISANNKNMASSSDDTNFSPPSDLSNPVSSSVPSNNKVSVKQDEFKKITDSLDGIFGKITKNYSVGIKLYSTGEQYVSDSKQMPSASVIKVFIMLHAYRMIENGEIKENVMIQNQSLNELLKSMITKSDNNATNILINFFGMDRINETIRKEGYNNTVLQRLMLDYDAQKQGLENYTSISDVMLFLDRVYQNKEKSPYKEMLDLLLQQQVKTKIPSMLPKGTKVANKTGELQGIENDIGIVFSKNGDYAIAALVNQVLNVENTRQAIGTLSKNVYDYLNH